MSRDTKAQPNGSRPAQAAQQQLKPARRKGKPWNPAGHLGIPTPERAAKSGSGFQQDNMAGGDGPKVPRSIERAPITLPTERVRITEEEVERAIRMKRAPDPLSKMTAIDRMLEEHEWEALCWYILCHHRREVGRPTQMRYVDTPRGPVDEGDGSKEARWRLDLRALEFVDTRLHEAGKDVLDLICWMTIPGFREGRPPSKIDLGRAIIKVQGRDRAEGGIEGYLRCMSQFISEHRAEFAIEEQRRRDRMKRERAAELRKLASQFFDTEKLAKVEDFY